MTWFWQSETAEQKAARLQHEQDRDASIESLARGGLPVEATRRLQEEAKSGNYSSGLSVREMLLTKEGGYSTVGQVMGSTFYHFGTIFVPVRQSAELPKVAAAQVRARRLALGRLQQEAEVLGAGGVIGVRFKSQIHEWGMGTEEFTALGTAVRPAERPQGKPWISNLSGQDFWKLAKAGYRPVGVAMGAAVEYVYPSDDTWSKIGSLWTSWGNNEVTQYSDAFQRARRNAERALRADAHDLGALGVVGMEVVPNIIRIHVTGENTNRDNLSIMIRFVAMGTAIIEAGTPAPTTPQLVQDLARMAPAKAVTIGGIEGAGETDDNEDDNSDE